MESVDHVSTIGANGLHRQIYVMGATITTYTSETMGVTGPLKTSLICYNIALSETSAMSHAHSVGRR